MYSSTCFQVMIIIYTQRKYRLKNICNIVKTIKHTEKLYRMYILFLCCTMIQSTYRSGWFWQRIVGLANHIPKPEIQKKTKVNIKTFKKASSWETPTTLRGVAVPRSSPKLEWLSVKRSWVKESRRMWFSRLNMAFPGLGGKVRAQIPFWSQSSLRSCGQFPGVLLLLRSVIKLKLVP